MIGSDKKEHNCTETMLETEVKMADVKMKDLPKSGQFQCQPKALARDMEYQL